MMGFQLLKHAFYSYVIFSLAFLISQNRYTRKEIADLSFDGTPEFKPFIDDYLKLYLLLLLNTSHATMITKQQYFYFFAALVYPYGHRIRLTSCSNKFRHASPRV